MTLGLQGERFGQKLPPLTEYLRGVTRDYPKGIGIVKEFVQNADDAGASLIKVVVDWRTHPSAALPGQAMAALMGPAILFYNDAQFTDRDLEGIEQLSLGGKASDTAKTGRFGLGFNSAYNVTDVPSFLTRDRLYFFDPHGTTVYGARPENPGQRWPLKVLWDKAPDLLTPFLPLDLKQKQPFYPATAFRLPFRTEEQARVSEISNETFGRSDVEAIFGTLETMGAELLLFLRHLMAIEVYEIPEDATAPQLRCAFRTKNTAAVKERRDRLRQWQQQRDVFGVLKTNRKLSVSYQHVIEVVSGQGRAAEVWRVVNGLYCDLDGALVEEAQALNASGEKVFPSAGAAALVSGRGGKGPSGSAYCFLPLPDPTQLPVHVHGFFDLDRSRRNLTDDSGLSGNDARRGRWNRLLVEHAVAAAYAELLVELRKDVGEADPAGFYRYWPLDNAPGLFAQVLPSLVRHLEEERVISTTAPSRWRTFEESVTIEAEWACLKEPLAAMGLAVADPALPPELERALRDADAFLQALLPNRLAQELRLDHDLNRPLAEVEQPWLRERAWLKDLLRFCLRNPYADLSGLPLALMADGKLRTFGRVRAFDGSLVNIYLGGSAERSIFSSYASMFVEAVFARETGLKVAPQAQLRMMTPALVVWCLPWVLNEQRLTQPHSWQPRGEEPPNGAWLTEVYEYLTAHKDGWWDGKEATREAFKRLALVPDQFGALKCPGFADTPLLLDDKATPLEEALNYLDVPIVFADTPLKQAMNRFADTFGEFVYRLTPVDLVDTLGSLDFLGDDFETDVHGPILDFFSTPSAVNELLNGERSGALAELKIFPVSGNKLVSLKETNTYLSVTRNLPPDLQGAHFLNEGPSSRWRGLFQSLGAEELTEARIAELVLNNYAALDEGAKQGSLTWLRDNLSVAERAADEQMRTGAKELRERLAQAPLVRCDDGLYRAARETYTPDAELPRKVLGASAPLPDMTHYREAPDRWLEFFGRLGMASSPRPADLVAYLDLLLGQADREGVQTVEAALAQFGEHISQHWSELERGSDTFAADLRKRAWLPSLQRSRRSLPGFVAPEDRLYRPEEIYAASSVYLVISQAPVLPFSLSGEMRTALEMPARPDIETVLRHFNYLLELWHALDHSGLDAKPFGESMEAIYRFLGNSDGARLAPVLAAYATDPCLWDPKSGKLWPPRCTFGFGAKTDVFGSRRVQLSSDNKTLDDGYKALGRRDEVEPSDYLEFLLELFEEYEGRTLSDSDQRSVLKVLDYLRLETDPDQLGEVPMLTQTGTLALADEVYLNDAYWLEDRIDNSAISLLHKKTNDEFALAIGVHLLSECIQENLADSPVKADHADTLRQCQRWQDTIHSPEFAHGVLRLIKSEGSEVRVRDLRLFERVEVIPVKEIHTTLWLETEGREIGSGRAEFFPDLGQDIIYLAEPPIKSLLADALNQTLEGARLQNTSALGEILDISPSGIARQLDRLHIARLVRDANEEQEVDDVEPEHIEDADFETDFVQAVAPGIDAPTTAAGRAEPTAEAARERSRPPQQHGSGTQVPEPDTKETAEPPKVNPIGDEPFAGGAARSAGSKGASRPRKSSERSASSSGSAKRTKQSRHRTFVYAEHETATEDDDKDEGTSARAQSIGRAAELKVMAYERREGRMPDHYGGNNEGFDIVSTSADGSKRYIEVKGIDGPWGERGVALSAPQYRKALAEGGSYWLYVVEYALDDEAALITAIANPAGTVTRYVFDAGWRMLDTP